MEGHGQFADAAGVRAWCYSTAWREKGERTSPSGDPQHISETLFLILVHFCNFVHREPDLICHRTVITYEADTVRI